MKCPLCHNEMRIERSRYVIENDDSADNETKLYVEMDMTCKNPSCPNLDKLVETVRNEQTIG